MDASISIKNDELGYVDSTVIAATRKDLSIDETGALEYSAKVKVRANRPP